MHLNPYGEYAVLLAASLANDWPVDRDALIARARWHGMTMEFAEAADDHARVREVIDQWLTVVDADPQERALILNRQMASAAAYPQITDHDGEGWHLHYRSVEVTSPPDVLAAVISVGTALHLTTRGMHRLGRCAAGLSPGDPCTAVVVDVTRNGRQQYCSVRCANRAAVRRHRSRARR
ncbi:MAG: CGNR zinc finger domain-containing protein [Gordonia sp. (in: high G+C Gram-positive bacteria)]